MKYTITLSITALLFVSSFWGCEHYIRDISYDSFSDRQLPVGSEDSDDKGLIRITVASMLSTRELFTKYSNITEWIRQKSGKDVELYFSSSYSDAYDRFVAGDVDMAFICSGLYVKGRRNGLFDLLVVPVIHGTKEYRAYLIAPKDLNTGTFSQLSRSKFLFTDSLSLTGYFYPLRRSISGSFTFEMAEFSGSHSNSIYLVNKGLAGGASVNGLVFEYVKRNYPEDVVNIRVLEKSVPFGVPPVVVCRSMEDSSRFLLKDILLAMDSDSSGKSSLEELGWDRFEPADDSLYTTVYEVVSEISK